MRVQVARFAFERPDLEFAICSSTSAKDLDTRTQNAQLGRAILSNIRALFQNTNKKIFILKPIFKGRIRKGAQNCIECAEKKFKTGQCLQCIIVQKLTE